MFDKYFTENLKENEELIDILHHHVVTFFLALVKILILFIIPFFFITFILNSKILTLFFLAYLALVLIFAVYEWIIWYFDVYIISDTRIIQIEQKGVFHRTVSEAPLERVQDVTFDVKGIFPTLFNYGDVKVQTASEISLELRKIAGPEDIKTLILELQKVSSTAQRGGMSAEDLVRALNVLRTEGGSSQKENTHPQPSEPSSKRRRQV